jgi:hypothetical protein
MRRNPQPYALHPDGKRCSPDSRRNCFIVVRPEQSQLFGRPCWPRHVTKRQDELPEVETNGVVSLQLDTFGREWHVSCFLGTERTDYSIKAFCSLANQNVKRRTPFAIARQLSCRRPTNT